MRKRKVEFAFFFLRRVVFANEAFYGVRPFIISKILLDLGITFTALSVSDFDFPNEHVIGRRCTDAAFSFLSALRCY